MGHILGQVGPPQPVAPEKKSRLLLREYQEVHCQLLSNILAGVPGKDEQGLAYFKAQTGNPNLTIADLPEDLPEATAPPFPYAVDTSVMGSGKTYSTGGLVSAFNARFLVIGFPSIEFKPWREFVEKYELPEFIDFLTYNKLSGGKDGWVAKIRKPGSDCSVPLLSRKTIRQKTNNLGQTVTLRNPIVNFTVTEAFKELVGPPKPGDKHSCTFIIFDEFHALKNITSLRRSAAAAMARYVMEYARGSCRMIYLSATPFDKEEHARSICYAMGIMKSDTLRERDETGKYSPKALGELVAVCSRPEYRYKLRDHVLTGQNPLRDVTGDILAEYEYGENFNGDNAKTLVYRLVTEVVFDKISSAMPPLNIPSMLYRGFFPIADETRRGYVIDGMELINEAIKETQGYANNINDPVGNFDGRITLGLVEIERGCVVDMCDYVFARVKAARAQGMPWKGVLGLNYMVNVETAMDYLTRRGGNAIVYAGKDLEGTPTPPRLRTGIVDEFQGNDAIEFMIVIIASGGVGISFHDDDLRSTEHNGGRKRIVVASPDYRFTAIHQFFGRFNRSGSRSVAECMLYYPNISYLESTGATSTVTLANILNSLAKKARVTDSTLFAASRGLIQYPGDYPRYIHGAGFVDEERAREQAETATHELVFELVPKLDIAGRPYYSVYLTSNEDASFGEFVVHESVDAENQKFDTAGRSLADSRYMTMLGDNSVYRLHESHGEMAIFRISRVGEVTFDYPIQHLSPVDAVRIRRSLYPLIEFNRLEDKEKMPKMVEIDTLKLITAMNEARWDDIPLKAQTILTPDWVEINKIDAIENEIRQAEEKEGKTSRPKGSRPSAKQTRRHMCPGYTRPPPDSGNDDGFNFNISTNQPFSSQFNFGSMVQPGSSSQPAPSQFNFGSMVQPGPSQPTMTNQFNLGSFRQ